VLAVLFFSLLVQRNTRHGGCFCNDVQVLRFCSYAILFGTDPSELSRPFAPNPAHSQSSSSHLIPDCPANFTNGTYVGNVDLGCGSSGLNTAATNPFNSFCDIASFSFSAGMFFGAFDAFHVQIWVVLYPVLMLVFALPFRFYGE